MTRKARASTARFTTETVWNAGLSGTGAAGEGRSLTVGHEGDWTPEHLLLLAAESCFMSTFLGLADDAGIELLGYVSNGQLHLPEDLQRPLSVVLSPCVVVGSIDDARRIAQLGEQAKRESIVARLLGDHLQVTIDVKTLPLIATA